MTWWLGAVVWVVMGTALASAQDVPPDDAAAYMVFAADEARIAPRAHVYGNAGANATVTIGRRTRIDGLVASPTIELGRRAHTGSLFCILVIGGDTPCLAMTSPVVAPGSLGVGLVAPGRDDVDVPRRAHRAPLEAGAYGRLRLGRKSELLLLGGDYLFERVTLSRRATLRCATDCRIGIRRTLRMGTRARVEATAGTPVRFDVVGQGRRTGVQLGTRARFGGMLWAPTTTVRIGRRAQVTERVMASRLRIGSRARIGTEPAPAASAP